MGNSAIRCMQICNQLTDLLEQDYQKIKKNLDGELYDEYKDMILEEIERVENIRQMLKIFLSLVS